MLDPRNTEPGQAAEMARYLGVGLTWTLSTGLFLYAGSLVDARLGSAPWLTLIGAFVGAVAGFWYMYRTVVIVPQQRRESERREGSGQERKDDS